MRSHTTFVQTVVTRVNGDHVAVVTIRAAFTFLTSTVRGLLSLRLRPKRWAPMGGERWRGRMPYRQLAWCPVGDRLPRS
jgi:hypothetical protein